METQKFCLKWDDFHSSVTSLLNDLRLVDEFCDITLCCDGARLGAHRVLLSACSPYFRQVLKSNACQQHMVFFIKGATPTDLHALVEFIYRGSVNLAHNQLASFIRTAEMLQIRGLSGEGDKSPLLIPPASVSPSPTSAAAAACYRSPTTGSTPHHHHSGQGQNRLPPNKRSRGSVELDCETGDSCSQQLQLSSSPPAGAGVGSLAAGPDSVSSCASTQSPPPQQQQPSSHHSGSHQHLMTPPPPLHHQQQQHPLSLAYHHQQQQQLQQHHHQQLQHLQHGVHHHPLHHQLTDLSHHTQQHQHHQQQHQSAHFKAEKEMGGEDDVGALGCLEATLGQVAKYDGTFGAAPSSCSAAVSTAAALAAAARLQNQPAVLSINEVHSHLMQSTTAAGANFSDLGGSSHTGLSSSTDDATAQAAALARLATTSLTLPSNTPPLSAAATPSGFSGSGVVCPKCCRRYRSQQALNNHMKQHMGLTTCPLCGKVSSIVPTLRMHLKKVHSLSEEAVYAMVPFNSPRARHQDLSGDSTGLSLAAGGGAGGVDGGGGGGHLDSGHQESVATSGSSSSSSSSAANDTHRGLGTHSSGLVAPPPAPPHHHESGALSLAVNSAASQQQQQQQQQQRLLSQEHTHGPL